MSSGLRELICELADEFDAEKNTSFDLWTYLPSYKEAEKHHGEYACEHIPNISDLMHEATLYLIRTARQLDGKNPELTGEEKNWYSCPCEGPHGDE